MRSAVLVPEIDGLPWQRLFRLALQSQTVTWGGWGNLVLPPPRGADDELFWRLLDVFDADSVHGLAVLVGDVKHIAPDYYGERVKEHKDKLPANLAPELVEQVERELARQPLVGREFDESLGEQLRARVAPFDSVSGVHGFRYEVLDPPPWPLVSVEKLRPYPSELSVYRGWPDDNRALLGAATHGLLSPQLADNLTKAGVRVTHLAAGTTAWSEAVTPRLDAPIRALAGMGLEKHFYPGHLPRGLVLCVGDAAWDFAFACALERLGVEARWVPTSVASNALAMHAYATLGRTIRQYAVDSKVRCCSVSGGQAADECIAAFQRKLADLGTERSDPLDLIPDSPARIYERENVGFSQMTLVHGGATPLLATPVPARVSGETVLDIYWMTDIEVEAWSAFRHQALARNLLSAPGLMDGTARAGREAVSYLCPSVMPRSHLSLATQAVCPKLMPLSFPEQVAAILRDAGWQVAPSDKGLYLRRTSDLFGGSEQLIRALSDERAPLMTAFVADGEDAWGWCLNDGRRYLTLDDFKQLSSAKDPDALVAELAEAGALIRGLVLKCSHCRAARFYRLADIGEDFQCSRCWLEQRVTPTGWMAGADPPWRYALAEVAYQFLGHDGDLPLLAAHDFVMSDASGSRQSSRRRVEYTGELDLIGPDGVSSELDIVVTDGTQLWVGEATTKPRLEKTNAKELKRLRRLREVADIVGARGALLINGGDWNASTIGRARAGFPGLWPKLTVMPKARRAVQCQPPSAMVPSRFESATGFDHVGYDLLGRVVEVCVLTPDRMAAAREVVTRDELDAGGSVGAVARKLASLAHANLLER
jgi:hypothetical protein